MGSVSTFRVQTLQWYVTHRQEMDVLRQCRHTSTEEPRTLGQAQLAEIIALRAEGKTQAEVAQRVGVSRGFVGRVERRVLAAVLAYLACADVVEIATNVLETVMP
jgi:hypothetical protein